MKQNFYFTFGTSPNFPFHEGYITIAAENENQARLAFGVRYPNRPGSDAYNFSFSYSQKEWTESISKYYKNQPPIKTFNAEDILFPALYSVAKKNGALAVEIDFPLSGELPSFSYYKSENGSKVAVSPDDMLWNRIANGLISKENLENTLEMASFDADNEPENEL